ncbi:carbonic anhydrase, partial [Lecanoromycetidae sp. Uapishka_2]
MLSASDDVFTQALQQNRQWAHKTATEQPELFPTLASGQHPQILWIGCSDSRIPETTVLGLQPGDVFVHRNIANIIPSTDINSQSVIFYAVKHLKVKHIVVCGHTSCGGVNAALGNDKLGLIDVWLTPLRNLRAHNQKAWAHLEPKERAVKLVEANVKHGVKTLKENAEVIEGMKERGVVVHGLVYDVASGELRELEIKEDEEVEKEREEAFGCH